MTIFRKPIHVFTCFSTILFESKTSRLAQFVKEYHNFTLAFKMMILIIDNFEYKCVGLFPGWKHHTTVISKVMSVGDTVACCFPQFQTTCARVDGTLSLGLATVYKNTKKHLFSIMVISFKIIYIFFHIIAIKVVTLYVGIV